MQAKHQFAAGGSSSLFGWLALLSVASFTLAGCGAPTPYQQPSLQVESVLWSPSGWLSLMTTRPSMVILGLDGSLKRTIPYASPFSWSPSGRYLLYRQMSSADPDYNTYQYQTYQYQMGSYDCVSNSVKLTDMPPRDITWGFWYNADDTGYTEQQPASRLQYAVHILNESGNEIGQFPAPKDLTPWYFVCDLRNNRLFCSAYAFGHRGIHQYFYFVQDKHFTPLVNAEGYSLRFAYAQSRDIVAIAAVDSWGVLHRIDMLDLNQTNPSPHTLIAEARLPKRCYVERMALSADGSHLAAALATQDGTDTIYVYDLATGRLVKIGEGAQPTFSPNGKQIAFVDLGDVPNSLGTRVYVCNLDGSQMHEIYDEATFGERLASFLRRWLGIVLIVIVAGAIAARIRRRRARAGNSLPPGL